MNASEFQNERTVAYRALCLGALLQRSEIELTLQTMDDLVFFDEAKDNLLQELTTKNDDLLAWLQREKIDPHLSQRERQLLQCDLGQWSERTLISVEWRTESLGAMLWALHYIDDMPDYDEQFQLDAVLDPLDIYNSTIDFIWLASLRSNRDLQLSRDRAEIWNWRSRATELERMGIRPTEGVSFREIIRFTAERAYTDGHIPPPIEGDFPAFYKSYANLNHDEYAVTSAIAYERYFALNWVCEVSSQWESIRIDDM